VVTAAQSRRKQVRRSRAEAERTRRRIVEAASRLFRDRGIASVSISDITGSLGLTDGGFYRHFSSKEALVAEALNAASLETTQANMERVGHLKGIERASALIDGYLSAAHRADPAAGCPVAALCSEMRHESPTIKAAFTTALQRLLAVVDSTLPKSLARRRIVQLRSAAEMVGAVVLSRATDDESLAAEILEAVRRGLTGSLRG
jgi:TetR/AcrR family transcriptional regulator, transcriptional repressor for nem operon